MGCGETLVKYILFLSNLAFAVAGLALLGMGLAARLHVKEILDLTDETFQVAPVTCMVVGGIVFLIAFFGCCGAIKENNCMLVSYSILLFIMIIIKVTLAILIFMYLDTILEKIPQWLTEAFKKSPDAFHELEKSFLCCGPTGANVYTPATMPSSCCAKSPCNFDNAYAGCSVIVDELFRNYGLAIGYVAILVVCIEMVTAVFGLCLASYVRYNREQNWQY